MDTEVKKAIIRDTWSLRDTGRVPYLVEAGRHHLATQEFFEDDARELAWSEEYHVRLSGMDDYTIANIKPNMGIGLVAAALGCDHVPNRDADPWVKPLVTGDRPEAVRDIVPARMEQSPLIRRAFERLDYLSGHSSLPLRLLNVPSPLVAASQIWEYTSFLESTVTHPAEVHFLLDLVTDVIIEYVRSQLQRIPRLFTMGHEPLYIPADVGLRISDDTAAVLSPTAYRTFGVPYVRRLSEAFGGVIWHSCGDVGAVLPAVMEIPGLRGIDVVAPQNDWQRLRDAAGGRVAMILRHYFWDHGGAGADLVEYSTRLVQFFGRRGLFILTSAPTVPEARALATKLKALIA